MPPQPAPGAERGQVPAGNDPLAELARLIGQNDPFAEYGRQNAQSSAPPQPARVNPDWAEHVAADAGYLPPPAAPPPLHAGYAAPDMHPAEFAPPHEPVPGYAGGEGGYDSESYYPNIPASDGEHHDYYDDVPPRRRMGVLAIAAVFALAVLGTAGAFGYRALFSSSGSSGPPPVIKADTAPSKVVPANKSADKNGKLIYDRVAEHGHDEKLVSREEQPVDINKPEAGMLPPHEQSGIASGSIQPELGSGVVGGAPKKVHTIAIRPDGTVMANASPAAAAPPAAMPAAPMPAAPEPASAAEQPMAPPPRAAAPMPAPAAPTAPPHRVTEQHAAPSPARRHAVAQSNAPLSLNPNAPAAAPAPVVHRAAPIQAAPMQTAPRQQAARAPVQTAPAAQHGSGYAVQVASRHNEADAQAALRSLKSRYPQALAGHQTMVRRVDLGAKGIYFRAMFGPFASSDEAGRVCSQLKAAGGSCFVQRI